MKSNNLKDKLQNRTITPSSNSWEKLNDKLAAQENKENGKKWLFLKYAAVILILVSVGFFFFQSEEEIKKNPIIVSPTLKKDFNRIPKINEEVEAEVAVTPIIKLEKESKEKNSIINKSVKQSETREAVAFREESSSTIKKEEKTLQIEDFKIEESILLTENNNIKTTEKQQNIDLEIDQLLINATIKRANSTQNLNKGAISANDLLFEVEEDLDKDLKQKLFETIVKTLKNPKEVITDIGN